jgi:hypothetical protein
MASLLFVVTLIMRSSAGDAELQLLVLQALPAAMSAVSVMACEE